MRIVKTKIIPTTASLIVGISIVIAIIRIVPQNDERVPMCIVITLGMLAVLRSIWFKENP